MVARYFAGLAATKPHTPESGKLGWLKTHAHPRMLGQGVFLLQKPRQVVWATKVWRNWWAETVPAKRTATTSVVKNEALMVFVMMLLPCYKSSYFPSGWTPVGCDEQNPVVASSAKAQMQPVEQGCTLLQLPLQAAKPRLSVRNWRADTVPAQRTAVTMVVSNIVLILFMTTPLLKEWIIVSFLGSGFAASHPLFQVNHGGVSHHPCPDFFHFSSRIKENGLRRELKAVIQHHTRLDSLKYWQARELVLRKKRSL
jgi:hypothetical protein